MGGGIALTCPGSTGPSAILNGLLQLLIGRHIHYVGVPEGSSLRQQPLLQQCSVPVIPHVSSILLPAVAAHEQRAAPQSIFVTGLAQDHRKPL